MHVLLQDMCLVFGENVYCVEVEQIIGSHPAVAAVACFGLDDLVMGQKVVGMF
jgi:acyl-CoA synthetase (AMP-forming)/AMP-acid ligase II